MFTNEILTPGEKVKKIRKVIGASQQDIAGDKITRNLISQIENGKTNLVLSTAEIICNNIKIFMKNHINNSIKNLEITPELLLEDEEVQANRIAEEYLKELRMLKLEEHNNVIVKDKLVEIENFLKKWTVDFKKEVEIYELMSSILFKLDQPCESVHKIQTAIDLAMKYNLYKDAVKLMITSSKMLYESGGSQLETVRNINIALNLYNESNISSPDLLKNIYFNLSVLYSELDMYDTSLEYLNKLISDFKLSIKEELDINLLKAICYEDTKQFKQAEKLYLEILDISLKHSYNITTSKIYNSLGSLYQVMGDKENSVKYINISLNIKNDIEPQYYARTLYYAVDNFMEMDCYEHVRKYYNIALNYLEKIKNKNLYYKLIVKLYDYFDNKKKYEVVFNLLRKIEISIKTKIITDKDAINLFFITSHKFKNDNRIKSDELFEKGIELLKFF